MKTVLIVGKKFSGLTNYLIDHGYEYITLQDVSVAKSPEKKLKRRILADFSSRETILESLKNLPHVDAVMTMYENYVLPTAWIAKALDLPGMPTLAAEACTDKYLMRSLFSKSPEKISPEFAEITSSEKLSHFANHHDFPLILKPANLAKSLLVTKSNNLEELKNNYQKSVATIKKIYAKYAPNRQPKLIIEEFLEGSVHSVDAFVDKDGTPHILSQIVDYQTGYDIGYDDNFHYSRILPSKLSSEKQQQFLHCAELGVKALGMKNSPAHIEVIMTGCGPRIVEIGARNGGYRERMYRLSNGIDIVGDSIKIAEGKQPDIKATKNEPCAVLELFPKDAGVFAGVKNESKLRKLKSLNYLNIKAEKGDFIGRSSDGYKMTAIIILHHPSKKQFDEDLAFINQNVCVETIVK